jgi:ATP-binding cassette subfamily F protein 3
MMDALLEALQDYDGTIIFVSHDRYFIQKLASKYWVFHKVLLDNAVYPTIHEIDKPFIQLLDISYTEPAIEKPKTEQVNNRQKKINPWILEQLQKEIEQQHNALKHKQKELTAVQTELSQNETYTKADAYKKLHNRIADFENEILSIRKSIDQLETKYLELIYEP